MAIMNQEKKMYAVNCTECGNEIKGKYFPLNKLLDLYFNGDTDETERSKVFNMLGIGVLYGDQVLPAVPPLLVKDPDEEDVYVFSKPDLGRLLSAKTRLQSFACEDGELPVDMLVPVELNIAAIIAQFYLATGFETIYDMLGRYARLRYNGDDVENDEILNSWCEQLAKLLKENMSVMGQSGLNAADVRQNLEAIINFAETEARKAGIRHFSLESEIKAGWWYREINGRKMPYRLAVVGSSGEVYHCTDCCCDKCHAPLPYELGAYEQKIVGLLGTQSTGKTTYQTALADAIDRGEATSLMTGNGITRHTAFSIQPNMINDPQWARAKRAPAAQAGMDSPDTGRNEGKSGAGPLWLYQNGYPVEKTPDEKLEAGALTFLISREGENTEPIMYTLADIPGEAFSEAFDRHRDALHVERQYNLLKRCDSLIMVISARQLQDQRDLPEEEKASGMVRSPSEILDCYRSFLPDHAVPTAVVMTSADLINDNDLRRPLQLAFDPKTVSPMVWSDRKQALVYNTELMHTVTEAVADYLNRRHGSFVHDLANVLKEKGGKVQLEAFAVSSGTQCAKEDYKTISEAERSKLRCEERYDRMVEARFGVVAPLLWMLTCDGMLETGRPETIYNDYSADVQSKINKLLNTIL